MKQIEISERVEALLARTAALLRGENITTSFSDRLAIELLGDETTYACRVVQRLAGEIGTCALMRRIIGGIIEDVCNEKLEPECHYGDMCASLMAMFDPAEVTTAHLLYAVAMDETTLTSQALFGYGITAEDIKNLSSALKIPSKDLIEENPLVDNIGLYEMRDTKRVPVIGTVRCGAGGVAYEYIDEYITIDDTYRPDEMRGFRAEGDSMEPEIHDGDICLVHLQEEVPDGALAVVVICDGVEECEGTIKRVHKQDGAIILQATNQAYAPRIFTGENANKVHIVGRVVEIRHKTI